MARPIVDARGGAVQRSDDRAHQEPDDRKENHAAAEVLLIAGPA
jgi:hypothetical protein